jgi:uncharacterized membrane protein
MATVCGVQGHAGYDARMTESTGRSTGQSSGSVDASALPPSPPSPQAHAATRSIESIRTLALVSTIGLVVLGLGWELWWAPTGSGTLALKVVPLLLPLPGLWRHRMSTYRWLSLLVWFYFAEGMVRATSDRVPLSVALAVVEVILSLMLFAACALHVRTRLRSARSNAGPHA